MTVISSNSFIPIHFLTDEELVILEAARSKLRKSCTKTDIKLYEFILDELLKRAVIRYREKHGISKKESSAES